MAERALKGLLEVLLGRKRTWNISTSLKFAVGGTEIGSMTITGKIQYIPE